MSVKLFEVVNIQHNQRQWRIRSLTPIPFLYQHMIKMTAIGYAG